MASTGEAVRPVPAAAVSDRHRDLSQWLLPALIGLVPVAFVLWSTANGIGLSPDSNAYLQPLRTGSLSLDPRYDFGQPLLTWVTGAGIGAVTLNSVALWCNLLVSHRLALTVSGSRGVALAVIAWLAASAATTQVYSMLWSEPVFVAAVNCVLLALVQLVRSHRLTAGPVAMLIVAANVAGAMRYTAMFLLPVIGVALLVAVRGPLARRVAVGAACGVTLAGAWAHNLLAGDAIMGPRPARADTVREVLVGVPLAAGGYVQNTLGAWTSLELGVAALLAVVVVVSVWLRTTHRDAAVVLLAGWVAFYAGSLVASSLTTDIDGVGFRLSAPVIASVVVLTFTAAAAVLPTRLCRWYVLASLAWMVPSTLWWVTQAGTGATMSNF